MISNAGIQLLQEFEGFRATPYPDGSKWAIGYGHNIRTGETFSSISKSEALSLLISDARTAEGAIGRCVRVPLSQPQLDALISLVYNWGEGNFCSSTLLKRLNAGDYQGAATRLREHPVTQDGIVLPALVRRRGREADLFLSGTSAGLVVEPQPGGTEDDGDNLIASLFSGEDDLAGPSIAGLVLLGAVIITAVLLFSSD